MTFLDGKFAIYKLNDQEEADRDALRTLKACDVAQKVFKRPSTSDLGKLWEQWETEREKAYNELVQEDSSSGAIQEGMQGDNGIL
jgi:hypothetical protein